MAKKKDPIASGASLSVIGVEPGSNSDVEVAHKKTSRRRRWAVRCCACCGVSAVILGIVILVLALTVFKVKDPRLSLNKLAFSDFDLGLLDRPESLLTVNATLIADISIKNPNAASFRFRNSTTMFYYNGTKVGVAGAPSGNARAHRTVRFNATVDVFAERVAAIAMANSNKTFALLFGESVRFNLSSFTEVDGRVNLWGLYRKNLEVKMNCSMTLEYPPITEAIVKKDCRAVVS